MTKKEMIMEAIEARGYKPQTDEEGDVFVRYQMKTIYFLTNDDEDDRYVSATLPRIAEVQEGEETLILAACNKVSRDVKLAKVYIDHTLEYVGASCEFFYTDMESLKYCVEHCMSIFGVIRSTFNQAREELRS